MKSAHSHCTRYILLLTFCLSLSLTAQGSSYYISPKGNDSNSGSQAAPWKTFTHSIPILNPGDTLFLMNGTYNAAAGTGFINVNCSSGANDGTSGAPITVQAQNERQAHIQGDGSTEPFQIHNCSYWNVIGLYVSDIDFTTQHENDGTFALYDSSNLVIRRNLLYHANRCFNNNLFFVSAVTNSLIEENELYFFHRWGIQLWSGSTGNEIRRNYVNPRGAFGAGNSTCSTYGLGPAGIGPYHGQNNTFENNIVENPSNSDAGNHEGFDNEADASNNSYLGNIALNMRFILAAHTENPQPTANKYADDVDINAPVAGFWIRGGLASTLNHDSVFGSSGELMGFGLNPGLGSNAPSGYTGGFGMTVYNSQVVNLTSGSDGAHFISSDILSGSGPITFSFDHDNNFNNSVTYNPNSNVTNPLAVNPGFGNCYLWVPAASPLHAAASDGTDVGATVLYQYVAGALTTNPLWDQATGAPLFKGATVSGLNDVAGNSLFDISSRLNINQNGCVFPNGYTGSAASSPPAPTGLTALVQ